MDLTDLHIFRSVVQAGGVTRAAEKLNRVQSNVTTRVRQLETDLGVELFVREGKRLHLSSAGKLLLDYADRLIDLAQEAREAVHDAKPRGLLRLGTGESTAAMRLPVPMNEYL
ncbi:MAG TPA: LysR family transcriptional regulator, partial [Xanthobacteraceae bacterium]|nr:LysR family transcriptional regulator [Xanthobacteraceae bacterium]